MEALLALGQTTISAVPSPQHLKDTFPVWVKAPAPHVVKHTPVAEDRIKSILEISLPLHNAQSACSLRRCFCPSVWSFQTDNVISYPETILLGTNGYKETSSNFMMN